MEDKDREGSLRMPMVREAMGNERGGDLGKSVHRPEAVSSGKGLTVLLTKAVLRFPCDSLKTLTEHQEAAMVPRARELTVQPGGRKDPVDCCRWKGPGKGQGSEATEKSGRVYEREGLGPSWLERGCRGAQLTWTTAEESIHEQVGRNRWNATQTVKGMERMGEGERREGRHL